MEHVFNPLYRARKNNRFPVRETTQTKEEVFKMFEDHLPLLTIVRLSGLSANSVIKLREKWKDQEASTDVPRAVPKIRLSTEFVRSRIKLLQNPPYSGDCELSTIPGMLEHYLELREGDVKKLTE